MSDTNDILRCDDCDGLISELDGAMFVWLAHADGTVESAGLLHKRCEESNDPLVLWVELSWLADPAEALERVASMAVRYRFRGLELTKLVTAAWAASRVATPQQAAAARRIAERMRGE